MSNPVIAVHNLVKQFPAARSWRALFLPARHNHWKTILNGVDLEVREGKVFGLLGPNGAGKTTLLKILATLLTPTGGKATVHGYDITVAPQRVRQTVGYCLDTDRSFYHRLTGTQNLEFFAALNNLQGRQAISRITEVLDIVNLNGAANQPFRTYSKGMRQKLGLARALLVDPAVLLLDEPTNGLDPGAAAEFRLFLRQTLVGEMGKTILLITHSLDEARDCCDRIGIMDKGKIAVQGTWAAICEFIKMNGFPSHTPNQ